jgi:hypothetical protein
MTGSPLPLEPLEDRRSKWLGGEAHIRYLGGASLRARISRRFGPGPYSRLALGLAFVAGGLVGGGLIGLVYRNKRKRRPGRS